MAISSKYGNARLLGVSWIEAPDPNCGILRSRCEDLWIGRRDLKVVDVLNTLAVGVNRNEAPAYSSMPCKSLAIVSRGSCLFQETPHLV
jgi:hypothetical protein